jgi:hypothetical protein
MKALHAALLLGLAGCHAVLPLHESRSDTGVGETGTRDLETGGETGGDLGDADPGADASPKPNDLGAAGCVDGAALSLTALSLPAVEPARVAFNATCKDASVTSISGFALSPCPAAPPLSAVALAAFQTVSSRTRFSYSYGKEKNRAEIVQMFPFSGYCSGGSALLTALDTAAGEPALKAWYIEDEVPCPNCHTFIQMIILYYTTARKVFVIESTYYWDS